MVCQVWQLYLARLSRMGVRQAAALVTPRLEQQSRYCEGSEVIGDHRACHTRYGADNIAPAPQLEARPACLRHSSDN